MLATKFILTSNFWKLSVKLHLVKLTVRTLVELAADRLMAAVWSWSKRSSQASIIRSRVAFVVPPWRLFFAASRKHATPGDPEHYHGIDHKKHRFHHVKTLHLKFTVCICRITFSAHRHLRRDFSTLPWITRRLSAECTNPVGLTWLSVWFHHNDAS